MDEYSVGEVVVEDSPTTTAPRFWVFVSGAGTYKTSRTWSRRIYAASVLHEYQDPVPNEPSNAVLINQGFETEPPVRPRSARNAAAIALIEEWLAEDSDYDEKTWPALKEAIEESRTSTRRRFSG